jgi:hypothetical protein
MYSHEKPSTLRTESAIRPVSIPVRGPVTVATRTRTRRSNSSPFRGVLAVTAAGPGLRRGHVICSGVSAVADVKGAGLNRCVIPVTATPELAARKMPLPSSWPGQQRPGIGCHFRVRQLAHCLWPAQGSHGITVRIPDQILHRLQQFRLLAAYPKIPPVKVP